MLYGTEDQKYKIEFGTSGATKCSGIYETPYEGVIPNLQRRYKETESEYSRSKIEGYMKENICETCKGNRLRPEVLSVTVGDKSIINVTDFSIVKAKEFFAQLELTETEKQISKMILYEIKLGFRFYWMWGFLI